MLTDRPRVVTQAVECDRCYGTGREAAEWDIRTGAAVAFKTCCVCLGRGMVRQNVPAPSCAA